MSLRLNRRYEAGEICVTETEHLFGFDLIFSRKHDGHWVPHTIITRSEAVTDWEWAQACRVPGYQDSEQWGIAAGILSLLTDESIRTTFSL